MTRCRGTWESGVRVPISSAALLVDLVLVAGIGLGEDDESFAGRRSVAAGPRRERSRPTGVGHERSRLARTSPMTRDAERSCGAYPLTVANPVVPCSTERGRGVAERLDNCGTWT